MMAKLGSLLRQCRHPGALSRRLFGEALVRTGLCRHLTLTVQDFTIHFHPAALPLSFFINPDDRSADYRIITALLRPGDFYVDVGANVGTTVIPAAKIVGVAGRVCALEAHPRTAAFLRENLALNRLQNVEVLQVAADAVPGRVAISDRRLDDMNFVTTASAGISVGAMRLDDAIDGDAPIALLKIDVEGAEMRVLAGATGVLRRTAAIYIEVSDTMLRRMGSSAAEVVRHLEKEGFSLFRVLADGTIRTAVFEELLAKSHSNVLALRDAAQMAGRISTKTLAMDPACP